MSRRLSSFLICCLISVSAFLALAPILRNNFINWDDRDQITQNGDFNPVRLGRMVEYWKGPYVGSLYPVSYNLFGLLSVLGRTPPDETGATIHPFVFHLASIVIHAASALLVFAILRLLVKRDRPACAGALLFAVHPVQVEAVAWVSGMNTLLFAMLSLWAIWQFLLASRPDVGPNARAGLLLSATIAFVLALWTKPTAVVTPLIAGLLVYARPSLRPKIGILIAWLILAIPIVWITRTMQTGELITPTPLWTRPFVAGDAITFYLYKLLAPIHLLVDYGRMPQWVREHPTTWLLLLVPVAMALLCWRYRHRFPRLAIAFAVFVVALLPVLGLTPFDVQMISTVTDRYLYLAMLAPALIVAALLARTRSPVLYTFVTIILIVLTIRSHARARQWRDEFTLFQPELRLNPRSLAAHQVLGVTHSAAGRYDPAAYHLEEALKTKPDDPRSLYNLGNLMLRVGRFDRAIELYRAALVKFPRHAKVHNNLGVALAQTGDLDGAEAEFRRALELKPGMAEALQGLDAVAKTRAATTRSSSSPFRERVGVRVEPSGAARRPSQID